MDTYAIFFVVGWIGGGSLMGICWLLWWERRRQTDTCAFCDRPCIYCWPDSRRDGV